MMRWRLLVVVLVAIYLATGVFLVQPDEQALVRRFGRFSGLPREPGPHWGLPRWLDRVEVIKPHEIKRISIGRTAGSEAAVGERPAQFLTGDRNLVNVRATVQYEIRDAALYLTQTESVDRIVATSAEATLAEILAGEPVDRALTLGKRELAVRMAERLQQRTDAYKLGIAIRSVDVGAIEPPAEVADAFDKVTKAQREREQAINQAHSFANKTLAQATGDAQQLVDLGRADRDRNVLEAKGETERFERLLAEYARAPQLTAARLYLETVGDVLPKLRSKLIMASGGDVDLSILREDKK